MNAGLSRDQIEYIQSVVGRTEMDYQLSEDVDGDYNENNKHLFPDNYDELSKESDQYWWDLISSEGQSVSKKRNEKELRWYNIAYQVRKIGEKYFELMYVSENRSEQQDFNDIITHYIDWEWCVDEVYPYEKVIIDYK